MFDFLVDLKELIGHLSHRARLFIISIKSGQQCCSLFHDISGLLNLKLMLPTDWCAINWWVMLIMPQMFVQGLTAYKSVCDKENEKSLYTVKNCSKSNSTFVVVICLFVCLTVKY